MSNWTGKRVVITGICGTVGRELLKQVLREPVKEVVGLDNNESELFFMSDQYRDRKKTRFTLTDIRDVEFLRRILEGADVVLHSAAFKHVIMCEEAPRSAVQNNILGTQNLIDVATDAGVERVIFTSSDKAVNPTSVMGTSKLMGERLMTAANAVRRGDGPIFASTRFGNVLGSRGSVIPLFRRQIGQGGPITLTDRRMTRFIMTLEEAVGLVMDSVMMARGGEVFVTKMPVIRIRDLAKAMIQELASGFGFHPDEIQVVEIGSKAGEKLFEELLNQEETRRTVELDRYFVVLPAFDSIYEPIEYSYPGQREVSVKDGYNSSTVPPMELADCREYLIQHELLKYDEKD